MNNQEREDYDDHFAKQPRFPFAIYVAARIWAAAGCLLSAYSMKYMILDVYYRMIDIGIVGVCFFWFVVGIAGGLLGIKYACGIPKSTRLLFVGSVVVTILCFLALIDKVIYFLKTPIVRTVGSAQSNFQNEFLILSIAAISSCLTALLVRNGSSDYRIWKEHQIQRKNRLPKSKTLANSLTENL